jgi:hypothetical protein
MVCALAGANESKQSAVVTARSGKARNGDPDIVLIVACFP